MTILDDTISGALDAQSRKLADELKADVLFFVGGILPRHIREFRACLEGLKSTGNRCDNLAFLLQTEGGLAECAEKIAELARHHYEEIWFVVPDFAMSAGTILCMSGDKIYMDYSSSLGPIDPQVYNANGQLVPALGYLDQVERMIEKSKRGELTDAEFAILQNQDLGVLRRYEQAKDLSVSLLKEWLVKYKFKDWNRHSSTGEQVTLAEKKDRAEEIAKKLNDHKRWHSHGRMIGLDTLTDELKLKIEDYSKQLALKTVIRQYNDLLTQYVAVSGVGYAFHVQGYRPDGPA